MYSYIYILVYLNIFNNIDKLAIKAKVKTEEKKMSKVKTEEIKVFEFIQFTCNGFYAIKDIQTGQTVAVIDRNINRIYQKLYESTVSNWLGGEFQPSDSLPNDVLLYCNIASILYDTAKLIHLKKESFKSACKHIKGNHSALLKSDKLLLSDAMSMPNFYRYVIDISSIIDMIESDIFMTLDDKSILNDVKSWLVLLYKYIMINADCEFIEQNKDIFHLTALTDLKKNQALLIIWRNGKKLIKYEQASTFAFTLTNSDVNESISIVDWILSDHINLGINIYVKDLFKKLCTIVNFTKNGDIKDCASNGDGDGDECLEVD